MTIKTTILLGLVLILGASLRITGIDWGLPTEKYVRVRSFHPDESVTFNALATMNPQKYDFEIKPTVETLGARMRGTLQIYLTGIWLKLLELFKLVKISTDRNFYELHQEELVKLYIAARMLSVLFGIATIILVFFIGKVFYGDFKVAILTSFFLAISPLHVVWSHYIGTDIILSFEICLVLLLSYYITKCHSNKLYIFTGILVGLTLATKYSSPPIIIVPFVAHFISKRRFNDKKLLLYGLFIIVGFFIGNPYSIINPSTFIQNIKNSLKETVFLPSTPSNDAFEILPGWIYYLTTAPKYALGMPFAILSLFGLIYSILKREKSDILILSTIVSLWLLLGCSPWRVVRWFTPFVPFLCLLSARAILSIGKYKIPIFIVVFVTSLYTLIYSYSYVKLMSEKDVRDKSSEWIENNIPEGAKIAVFRMYFSNPSITMTLHRYKETNPVCKNLKKYKILDILDAEKEKLPFEKKLQLENPDYVILSDFEYFPILKLKYKFPNKHLLPFLNMVMNSDKYKLIKKFEKYPNIFGIKTIGGFYPHDWRLTCPTILIYKRTD